jgi:hypothetical protein
MSRIRETDGPSRALAAQGLALPRNAAPAPASEWKTAGQAAGRIRVRHTKRLGLLIQKEPVCSRPSHAGSTRVARRKHKLNRILEE